MWGNVVYDKNMKMEKMMEKDAEEDEMENKAKK